MLFRTVAELPDMVKEGNIYQAAIWLGNSHTMVCSLVDGYAVQLSDEVQTQVRVNSSIDIDFCDSDSERSVNFAKAIEQLFRSQGCRFHIRFPNEEEARIIRRSFNLFLVNFVSQRVDLDELLMAGHLYWKHVGSRGQVENRFANTELIIVINRW